MNEADNQRESVSLKPINSIPTIQTTLKEGSYIPLNLPSSSAEIQHSLAFSAFPQGVEATENAMSVQQVQCLLQELAACHQKVQHQQILTESLTAQLQSSQERIAQLERECSFTQANYNQQYHQLMQTENACRELHARLTRQQSQTLQLKLALEKSSAASISHQAQPIQPWSTQPQSSTNELETNEEPLPLPEPIAIQDTAQEAHLQSLVDMLEAEEVTDSSPTEHDEPLDDLKVAVDSAGGMREEQWPSPIVYPSRPPKGRKSLAAIELPTFNTSLNLEDI